MISELAITRAFEGYRGKKAGDLDALAHAVVALSQLALSDEYDVVDAEINPLILRPEGRRRVGAGCAGEALLRWMPI